MDKKCPFCGAVDKPYSSLAEDHCHFVGEWGRKFPNERSNHCYERQIADIKESLEKTEQLWQYWHDQCLQTEASRDRWKELALGYNEQCSHWSLYRDESGSQHNTVTKAIAALKAAGEWEG